MSMPENSRVILDPNSSVQAGSGSEPHKKTGSGSKHIVKNRVQVRLKYPDKDYYGDIIHKSKGSKTIRRLNKFNGRGAKIFKIFFGCKIIYRFQLPIKLRLNLGENDKFTAFSSY